MLSVLTLFFFFVTAAHAQLQPPLPKVGSCPSGFVDSRNSCIPLSTTTRRAIVKGVEECPPGWRQSGSNYCLEHRRL